MFSKREPSQEVKVLVYQAYYDTVYRVALYITQDHATAEDVTQETFKTALENYWQLKDPGKLRGWLTKIAVNQARASCNFKNRVISTDHAIIDARRDTGTFDNQENELIKLETKQEIMSMILSLPEDFQTVVILRYYDEFNVQEIADLLGIPVGTVKSRLSRARVKLEKLLTENGLYYAEKPELSSKRGTKNA